MTNKVTTIAPLIQAGVIMSKSLIFLKNSDTMRHAAALFLDKKISGAPVLNHLNEPIGVLSKTDIVRYEREYIVNATDGTRNREAMRTKGTLEHVAEGWGYHRESEEDYVNRWMTPKVYTLSIEASLTDIIREMSNKKVHRLFIRDKSRRLVGVITTFDMLLFLGRVFFVKSPKKNRAASKRLVKKATLVLGQK